MNCKYNNNFLVAINIYFFYYYYNNNIIEKYFSKYINYIEKNIIKKPPGYFLIPNYIFKIKIIIKITYINDYFILRY